MQTQFADFMRKKRIKDRFSKKELENIGEYQSEIKKRNIIKRKEIKENQVQLKSKERNLQRKKWLK